jgi:peptidyl-dipeptidase A
MKHFPCRLSLPALLVAGVAVAFGLAPCAAMAVTAAQPQAQAKPAAKAAKPAGKPAAATSATADEARKFLEETTARLLELAISASRAEWVQQNFITEDTEALFAARQEELLGASIAAAKEARRFDGVELPADLRRQLDLLKQGGISIPAPSDPAKTGEVSRLSASLSSQYGAGEYCRPGGECLDLEQLSDIIEESRDPKELLEVWTGWHAVAPPMRDEYQRLVELANEGARELGYKDVGALWRSGYDMPPDDFAAELDRLWGQVKPLYDSLHCHVRAKLNEKYGGQVVALDKPIPAHLLGNMWAQSWDNLYDLVAPPQADPGYDLTERLKAKKMTEIEMVKTGEAFFSSLGFAPLPETFWKRSLFVQPKDHEAVCHASAWNIDFKEDLRIKMCIQVNSEDFSTIHHELGHNYYYRAYNQLPFLFQTGANDGFHEAVGDAVALSITPAYLKQIGLIEKVPDPSADLGLLMRSALEEVAFLPFGLLVDQWRWKVFSGEIPPTGYNQGWWDLRRKYQGVGEPVARSEKDFDAAAKYHVPGNTPYTRYFLAEILQFQFHRALCQAAGQSGPLHRCSIYGNKAAGERLQNLLALGASRPWQEALKAATGSEQMDATAIIDYYAPLKTWLDQQNRGRKCGW